MGRPSKLTPERQERICRAVAPAAGVSNISTSE